MSEGLMWDHYSGGSGGTVIRGSTTVVPRKTTARRSRGTIAIRRSRGTNAQWGITQYPSRTDPGLWCINIVINGSSRYRGSFIGKLCPIRWWEGLFKIAIAIPGTGTTLLSQWSHSHWDMGSPWIGGTGWWLSPLNTFLNLPFFTLL